MKELLRGTNIYRTIAAEARAGELPHTVLALFPDEKYLRALLKECAKAIFLAEDGTRTERLIDEESYADCLFFPAAGGKLSAEDGARILDESALRPLEGEKKLFVLDAFHTVSPIVQNKLLKALEEPPAGVYFLLGATESSAVLPTVLSRASKLTEPPFSEETVERALVRGGAGEGAREAAAACGGVYSLAETLLAGGGEEFRLAERFLSGEDAERLCREIGDRKEKRAFFAAVRLYLRDMLFYATGREEFAAMRNERVARLARRYPAGALLSAIGMVSEAERDLKFNTNFSQAAYALALGIREETEKWNKLSS